MKQVSVLGPRIIKRAQLGAGKRGGTKGKCKCIGKIRDELEKNKGGGNKTSATEIGGWSVLNPRRGGQ